MNFRIPSRVRILLIFLFIGGACNSIFTQTFEEARHLAFSGERARAREICKIILGKGFNSDVALLLARTYAWDGKNDSTRLILNDVLARNPASTEALDAYADVEYWSGNYAKAIEYCDRALKKDSVSEAFMYKKARILHSSGKYEEAVSTLEKLIRINPSHSEAYKKLVEFRPDVLKNNIRATYTLDLFDPDFSRRPWQIASLAYGRKTKLGTVIARLNLADRFGESGLQGEVDAYPRINENNYCYLNYGYSSSGVFPRNRAGLEWYHNFPKAFEGSVGMRLLDFRGSTVGIYTFTVGKYAGNYWISLRSFFTPGSDGTSVSGLIQVRRYFADPENYFGLRLGYGVSPDDNRNLLDSNRQLTLKTRSVRLEYNHIFNHVWILNAGAVWGAEERIPKTFSGYYTIDISVSRLF